MFDIAFHPDCVLMFYLSSRASHVAGTFASECFSQQEASRVAVSEEPRSKRARISGPAAGRNVDRSERTVEIGGFRYNRQTNDVVSRVRTMVDNQEGVEQIHGKFIKCSSACTRFAHGNSILCYENLIIICFGVSRSE